MGALELAGGEITLRLTPKEVAFVHHWMTIHEKTKEERARFGETYVYEKTGMALNQAGYDNNGEKMGVPVKLFGTTLTVFPDKVVAACGSIYDEQLVNKLIELRCFVIDTKLEGTKSYGLLFFTDGQVQYTESRVTASHEELKKFFEVWRDRKAAGGTR